MSNFIDQARIYVQAGNGGNGAISFRREKYVPFGGPDGGDGGRGGNVILVVDQNLNTLHSLNYRPHLRAGDGKDGGGGRRHGKSGADLLVRVPPGTIVYDDDGNQLADLTRPGQRFVVARGGKGGRGNARFATSTQRAPRMAEKGEPGEQKWVRLELKLLADVGLVGMPNAGKSTLLRRISAARPKTAAYPFTTLKPILGVVELDDDFSFVCADIPGLIEGAHAGAGLGYEFLRHIERTRVLVHVVDASGLEGRDPVDDYHTIKNELREYSRRLVDLPRIVVANKADMPQAAGHIERLRQQAEADSCDFFAISAISGTGISPLLGKIRQLLEQARAADAAQEDEPVTIRPDPAAAGPRFQVEVEGDAFRVTGKMVERWVVMTDLDNPEAVLYLHRRLRRAGVVKALRKAGAEPGDIIRIGDAELEFMDI